MMDQLVTYKHSFKADAVRYTDEELARMEAATMAPARPVDTAAQRRQHASPWHNNVAQAAQPV
jgi:carboxypeptidase Q